MLAELQSKHSSELSADFQQYYGLDIGGIGDDFGYLHAADLAAQLPRESRSFRAINPELEWTTTEYMLWSIEYSLRVLRWQNTEDGHKNRNKPEPLPTPKDYARVRERTEATDMEYIAQALGIDLGGE